MKWTLCDTYEVDIMLKLKLYQSEDDRFLKIILDSQFEKVECVGNGTFLRIKHEQVYYFAYSLSSESGILPLKIYAKESQI